MLCSSSRLRISCRSFSPREVLATLRFSPGCGDDEVTAGGGVIVTTSPFGFFLSVLWGRGSTSIPGTTSFVGSVPSVVLQQTQSADRIVCWIGVHNYFSTLTSRQITDIQIANLICWLVTAQAP